MMPTTPSGWYSTQVLPGQLSALTLRFWGFIHLRSFLVVYLSPSRVINISASLVSSAARVVKSLLRASIQASRLSSSSGLMRLISSMRCSALG